MELVNMLKEEIKKIASEENINVNKLNEYTHIYERLKLHEVTSVQELENNIQGNRQGMAYQFSGSNVITPVPYIGRPMMGGPRDDLGGLVDIFKEAVHMQKNSTYKRDEIGDYVFWIRFLKDVREDITEYWECENDKDKVLEDMDKLVIDVSIRTIELMRKKLENNIAGKVDEESTVTTIVPEAVMT